MTDVGDGGAFRAPPSLHWSLVSSFANKSLKAWPKDQLVLGDAGLQVSLPSSKAWGCSICSEHRDTSPTAPPTPAPTPPHDDVAAWEPPCFHPSLFPVREHAGGLGRIHTEEEEEAGPP